MFSNDHSVIHVPHTLLIDHLDLEEHLLDLEDLKVIPQRLVLLLDHEGTILEHMEHDIIIFLINDLLVRKVGLQIFAEDGLNQLIHEFRTDLIIHCIFTELPSFLNLALRIVASLQMIPDIANQHHFAPIVRLAIIK